MALNWGVVPERFRYFRHAVEACGETRIVDYDPVLNRHVSFTERATEEQLNCLALLQAEILRKGDASDIFAWCRTALHGTELMTEASSKIRSILAVLQQLADQGVPPFCDVPIASDDMEPMDDDGKWRLPKELEYLIGPALHFGERYDCELQMLRFFDEASELEYNQLAALAERVRLSRDWPRVLQWLTAVSTRSVRYACEIDRLFNLMDLCNLKFEPE